jgi:phosphodiesterase/alkaline phosphatase D-like protein
MMGDGSQILLGPIVGGLSHDSANLWVRATGPCNIYGWLGIKPDLSDAKFVGESDPPVKEDAFTGMVPVKNLNADTRYHYALTLEKEKPDSSNGTYPSFKTFPRLGTNQPFKFAFGSCFAPLEETSGEIFHAIDAQRMEEDLRFIILLGDQIYADGWQHNGINKLAITTAEYRQVYAYSWSRQPFQNLLKNLPAFMILDDHEVDNDWHWEDKHKRWAEIPFYEKFLRWLKRRPKDERFLTIHRVRDAMEAYWEHQGIHGPAPIDPLRLDPSGRFAIHESEGSLAYKFNFGNANFFVMDTRTSRIKSRGYSQIMTERQWQALETWLLEEQDKFPVRFLVSSSSILFDMLGDFTRDRWSGFQRDRNRLLNFIAAHSIENLYILTGDLHAGHAVEVTLSTPEKKPLTLWEFCASPFEQSLNKLAWTNIKALSPAVKTYKLHFTVSEFNYGVVSVDYPETGKSVVTFSLRGMLGNEIASVKSE